LAYRGLRVKRRDEEKRRGPITGKEPAFSIGKQSLKAGACQSMTPYFRSYAANFHRVRLLEMIDYRELPLRRHEMKPLLVDWPLAERIPAAAPAKTKTGQSS
jgi:hypothetical protein